MPPTRRFISRITHQGPRQQQDLVEMNNVHSSPCVIVELPVTPKNSPKNEEEESPEPVFSTPTLDGIKPLVAETPYYSPVAETPAPVMERKRLKRKAAQNVSYKIYFEDDDAPKKRKCDLNSNE